MMPSTFNSNTHERNWLELPSDVTANILKRVGMRDILENVENVCTAWHKICNDDPTMWRVIDTKDLFDAFALDPNVERCKRLVDRSQGQLVDISIINVNDDELLLYVARRSSQLRRLVIVRGDYCSGRSLTKALINFPLLEELSLYFVQISKEVIESAAHYCPMLRTLKVHQMACRRRFLDNDERSLTYNEKAIAIGENFPELKHLEMTGNNMSNIGLEAILNGCRLLETLDLRYCFYIDLKGDLGKRCSRQIKVLKMSQVSLEEYYRSEYEDDCYPDSPELYDGYISS